MTRAHDQSPVRRLREDRGLLLIELAQQSRCSAPSISMIEHGYVPKLPTMCRIADALGTTADQLWPEEFEAREAV